MPSITLIATSATELKGHPTGLWIEELASPYYIFTEAGYDVSIASPSGGAVPIDAASLGEGFFTEPAKKFMHDGTAFGKLSHTSKVSEVSVADTDAIFCCGGHGTCVDFIDNGDLKSLIENMLSGGKVVAAVCHGPMCLVDCVKADGVTPLVKDMAVTGFSDSEEKAVQLDGLVPFLLEAKLKEQGGLYSRGDDWSSKVCTEGKLVTGQNPQSSEACAEAVVSLLA